MLNDRTGFVNLLIQNSSLSLKRFVCRTLIFGLAVLVLSVLSGIVMVFWREYGSSLFGMPRQVALDLTIQATLGPIFLGFVLFMITVLVIFLLAVITYVGFRLRSLALSILPFVLLGAYWLWLVKLISDGAFD